MASAIVITRAFGAFDLFDLCVHLWMVQLHNELVDVRHHPLWSEWNLLKSVRMTCFVLRKVSSNNCVRVNFFAQICFPCQEESVLGWWSRTCSAMLKLLKLRRRVHWHTRAQPLAPRFVPRCSQQSAAVTMAAPGLGKLVVLAVGFQLICCQCFDQFGTDVVTDAMPLGFSMLETPEPSPFSLDAPRLQSMAVARKTIWQLCVDDYPLKHGYFPASQQCLPGGIVCFCFSTCAGLQPHCVCVRSTTFTAAMLLWSRKRSAWGQRMGIVEQGPSATSRTMPKPRKFTPLVAAIEPTPQSTWLNEALAIGRALLRMWIRQVRLMEKRPSAIFSAVGGKGELSMTS